MKKGDRHAHIHTLFVSITDAIEDKNTELCQFSAGYYAALYNEGYFTEKEQQVILELFKAVEKYTRANFENKNIVNIIKLLLKETEQALLEGGQKV